MSARANITGHRFGRLVAIAYISQRRWLCRCDCGREKAISGLSLRTGLTRSCGCLKQEGITHGHTHNHKHTLAYKSWVGMFTRCNNPNNPGYPNYGGRGITVCERWNHFENFLADMGERPPGLSLDRKNNDQGYSPDNCRWATRLEQNRNQRPRRPETYAHGEGSGNSKLVAEQIIAIRADPRIYQRIAEQYHVSIGHIRAIKHRKRWKHIP